jgi:transposase
MSIRKKWKKRNRRRNKASKRTTTKKQEKVRLIIKNKAWKELSRALEKVRSKVGAPGTTDLRLYIAALLHIARTGVPWRDLPSYFGSWKTIYERFRRWEANGTWARLWEVLQQDGFKRARKLFMDSTVVRAHQHAAGASKKSGGQEAQGLGRSRGGFSSKIHAGCIDESTSVALVVTAGQNHDAPVFDVLIEEVPKDNVLEDVVGDKGYDSDHIRQKTVEKEMNPVIPPRKNRKEPIEYNEETYKLRNKVERYFNKIKCFRRIATRYEKLSKTFMAFIHLVSAFVIVR